MLTQFIREGGVGMLIIGVWGLATFAMTVAFAWKPDERKQAFVHAMGLAILMMAVASTAVGVSMATHATILCRELGEKCPQPAPFLLVEGIGEALNNLAAGSFALAFVAFVYAFGRLRMRPA